MSTRGYDRNIFTERELREKLDYCHMNPITRGLVGDAADCKWSSYRFYEFGPGKPGLGPADGLEGVLADRMVRVAVFAKTFVCLIIVTPPFAFAKDGPPGPNPEQRAFIPIYWTRVL